MNIITPIAPGWSWVNRTIFMVIRCLPNLITGLLNLHFIHMARWVIINKDQWPKRGGQSQDLKKDYMLFCSNFNGTWDQYIDAFSDGIPTGLDLFWYANTKYPNSIPITPFKDYIVRNQVDTDYYYNATPGSAQRDIKAAMRLHSAVEKLAKLYNPSASPSQIAKFSEDYTLTLLEVQNCFAAPGYGPVASIDTERAENNLGKWVVLEKKTSDVSEAIDLRYSLDRKAESSSAE